MFKLLKCFTRHLETDSRHQIINGTIASQTFHIICSSILRSVYLSFLSFTFAISLLSPGIATSIRKQFFDENHEAQCLVYCGLDAG